MYLFPTEWMKHVSKIALYGAGTVGKDFFAQLQISGCVQIVVWVDEKFEDCRRKGLPVYPVIALQKQDFDHVIIAINNKDIYIEVFQEFLQMGISKEKILWQKYILCELQKATEMYWSHYIQLRFKRWKSIKEHDCSGGQRMWLMNVPEHGNMGDWAICASEVAFLRDTFPKKELIICTATDIENHFEEIRNRISVKDILFIEGGGNVGSLWKNEDARICRILKECPDNQVVFFPQTAYYREDDYLNKHRELFNKHRELLFIHRNRTSYNSFVEKIHSPKVKSICAPDMAFYLLKYMTEAKKAEENILREGILICFREDKERVLSELRREEILRVVNKTGYLVKNISTIYEGKIEWERGFELLSIKLEEFRKAKLVVTDRLHAMIFAYVTGTPCIAFDNLSGKVSGVYEWIKDCNYITLNKNLTKLDADIENYICLDASRPVELKGEYIKMRRAVEEYLVGGNKK